MTERLKATSEFQKIEYTEGHKRLLKAYEIYNNLTEKKIEDFKKVKVYLEETLEKLFEEGKIEREVAILSRVKSPSSVVKNWKLGKNLEDIFGITILTTKQEELDEIRKEIRKGTKFDITSKKEKKEKRGYEATHFCFDVGDGESKVKVECHLQTYEAYLNVYPHIFYKVRRELKRDLTPKEEKVISAQIQNLYERGQLSGYNLSGGRKSRLPQMWISSLNQEGKMEEQKLNEDLILTIMYPFLDISKKKKLASNQTKTEYEEVEI